MNGYEVHHVRHGTHVRGAHHATPQARATPAQADRPGPDPPVDDIRWRHAYDATGRDLGVIDELLVDEAEHKVRFVRVASGGHLGFGEAKALVPAELISEVTQEAVWLKESRSKIDDAPGYNPELVDDAYYSSIYDYYGY